MIRCALFTYNTRVRGSGTTRINLINDLDLGFGSHGNLAYSGGGGGP